jgi:hypothetical protein
MKRLRIPTTAELQTSLNTVVDCFIQTDPEVVEQYVEKLRSQNPGISNDDLARKIVSRKAFKCGLVGATTGIPGLLALPVTVPADLVASWRIQIVMAVAIARVYGHTAQTTDLKTDIYLILAGDAAKEALKRIGIEVGKEVSKRVVNKVVTRETMKQIWKVVGQKIITKAGQKSLVSFAKMVPLVGAPIGFAFNWPATKIVGNFAIKYYSGKG